MPSDLRATHEKFKKKGAAFRAEVVDKMSSLATAAFGLVAALAWNTAIQEAFKRAYPVPGDAVWALLGYAMLVTLVAVVVILLIGRLAARLKADVERAKAAEQAPPSG